MINKKLITKKALEEMIHIHGQKLLKAWLDNDEFIAKESKLKEDYDLVSDEKKQKVEEYMAKRLANPQGEMFPDREIHDAVSTRIGLDTMTSEIQRSANEIEFYSRVIEKLKSF